MNSILIGIAFLIGIFVGIITITWFTIIPGSEITLMAVLYVVGTIIALCAVGLTLWQGHTAREHNRLSVKPHLMFLVDIIPHPLKITLDVQNNGLGPAVIKELNVFVNETKQQHKSNHLVRDTIASMSGEDCVFVSGGDVNQTVVISPTATLSLANLHYSPISEQEFNDFSDRVKARLHSLEIEIIYESMYGEVILLRDRVFS